MSDDNLLGVDFKKLAVKILYSIVLLGVCGILLMFSLAPSVHWGMRIAGGLTVSGMLAMLIKVWKSRYNRGN